MKVTVIKIKQLKRLSHKVKTEYMLLAPGEFWLGVPIAGGDRVTIHADKDNTRTIYVGAGK